MIFVLAMYQYVVEAPHREASGKKERKIATIQHTKEELSRDILSVPSIGAIALQRAWSSAWGMGGCVFQSPQSGLLPCNPKIPMTRPATAIFQSPQSGLLPCNLTI